jgi:glutathione peroxidase
MNLTALAFTVFLSFFGIIASRPADDTNKPKQPFHAFKMNSIDGEAIDFSQYKGKKVMLVNVASKCGFTPQYAELEQLHEQYGDKLVILGFPANNFNSQEPGSNDEIKEFCQKNYGVKFQMFEKISVKGDDQHPLYQWLSKRELNGWNDEAPKWNFTKYLVNEKGELIKVFPSKVKPTDKEVIEAINS